MPELTAELGWSTIALVVCALALPVAAHIALRWWVRRETGARMQEDLAAGRVRVRVWIARALRTILPAVMLLVWIHAAYWIANLAVEALAPVSAAGGLTAGVAWLYRLAIVGAMCWLLARIGRLLEAALASMPGRTSTAWDDVVLPLAGKAIRRALPLLALILGAPALGSSPALAEVVENATALLLIGTVAFVLFQIVDGAAAFVVAQHRIDRSDNLKARSIHTQVLLLKRVAMTVIGLFTLASMLMVFEPVREFGASILASAGIAGIVIGFAAQRSIATLLAGFQIALTQPIRVDDVVIVENEWGRIEDITLTYVVVRVWDLRRLVVPITRFIEEPFQNWTRASSEILGTVFLHLDYSVPVDELRDELTRILTASHRWDGKVNVLQVTDATERTLVVRALASAADASLAWDLRCEIREKLIAFVQRRYPDALPRVRASIEDVSGLGHQLLASSREVVHGS